MKSHLTDQAPSDAMIKPLYRLVGFHFTYYHNFTLQIISILLYILVDFHFADCENAKEWLEAIFHHLD
jgi:hypothetical protein